MAVGCQGRGVPEAGLRVDAELRSASLLPGTIEELNSGASRTATQSNHFMMAR
jgi:hypothetical protein